MYITLISLIVVVLTVITMYLIKKSVNPLLMFTSGITVLVIYFNSLLLSVSIDLFNDEFYEVSESKDYHIIDISNLLNDLKKGSPFTYHIATENDNEILFKSIRIDKKNIKILKTDVDEPILIIEYLNLKSEHKFFLQDLSKKRFKLLIPLDYES